MGACTEPAEVDTEAPAQGLGAREGKERKQVTPEEGEQNGLGSLMSHAVSLSLCCCPYTS